MKVEKPVFEAREQTEEAIWIARPLQMVSFLVKSFKAVVLLAKNKGHTHTHMV